jgi:hypothetical protein
MFHRTVRSAWTVLACVAQIALRILLARDCHDLGTDYRRASNWWMDLLTTWYTHLETTAPPLISTIHKPLKHTLSLFQPAVFTSRSLATASNSGNSSASRAQVLSSQPPVQNSTQLIAPTVLVIIYRHGPHRKHRSSIVALVSFAPWTCLQSRSPEMHGTDHRKHVLL